MVPGSEVHTMDGLQGLSNFVPFCTILYATIFFKLNVEIYCVMTVITTMVFMVYLILINLNFVSHYQVLYTVPGSS